MDKDDITMIACTICGASVLGSKNKIKHSPNCSTLLKEPSRTDKLIEEMKEIVLEIRQYLLNTEFAPAPFTEPFDPKKLTIEFPKQLARVFKDHNGVFKVKGGLPISCGHAQMTAARYSTEVECPLIKADYSAIEELEIE